ncbi:MAG TPA: glycine--tRNA ligase subunit beta [Thermodesulfobacteriota bacterium]|nr:glycine--tRNA ligase subunit beta [Thermodesulfobacteriota bacterium]
MAKDLILELGSEELPAGFIHPALLSLSSILAKKLETARVGFKAIETFGAPRRLAVVVAGLDEKQKDVSTEVKGPHKKAAFDSEGKPTAALMGFARSQGVKPEELKLVASDKGEYVYAIKDVKGEKTEKILSELLRSAITELSFPKAMRWSDHDVTFARPLHWILALYGKTVVRFAYGHVKSADFTRGHRFNGAKKIKVDGVKSYTANLAKNFVIVEPLVRKSKILEQLEREAKKSGGRIVKDDALLEEVANLVEWPAVVKGSFNKEFLELPMEVVVNAMREHQRYFSLEDKDNRLLPYFMTVANTPAKKTETIIKGNERVLLARLNDAKFYFEKDVKTPLKDRVKALKGVVFQVKLGTSYEKVERFTRLAVWIGNKIGFCDYAIDGCIGDYLKDQYNPMRFDKETTSESYLNMLIVVRSAFLAKADLTSGMVGEFPKLQGVMGKEYAMRSGEAAEVAIAIYEHYLPIQAGGDLPETDAGALVSMADKLDTICGCFGVGLIPTGAADPYALRRQALGIIFIIMDKSDKKTRFNLESFIDKSLECLEGKLSRDKAAVKNEVVEFFKERLRNQLLLQNISHDSIEAILSTNWFDVFDAAERVSALEKFKKHPACKSLVIASKRVSNILKGIQLKGEPDETLFTDENEKALWKVSKAIEPGIKKHRENGDYEKAFTSLASIKDVIDKFFDKVMVMVDDEKTRQNRLMLLAFVSGLYAGMADLSKLVVQE